MILRILVLILGFGGGLAPPLFATTVRGNQLFVEAGGIPGTAGVPGLPGVAGEASSFRYADFFALQGGAFDDNPVAIAPAAAIAFPQDGFVSVGGDIVRTGASTFQLVSAGIYRVEFQVSVTEPAQLQLRLTSTGAIASSVVGRATGNTQIVGISYVTAVAGDILEVINASAIDINVTNLAGGTHAVSAHLVITRLQ